MRRAIILIVDDYEPNRQLYATMLRHLGLEVFEAANGHEAIAQARAVRPDMILMDLAMPVVDGWNATRVLKTDPATRHITIVALTANAFDDEPERTRDAGFDGMLFKPCPLKRIVAAVEAVVGPLPGRVLEAPLAAAPPPAA